MGISYTLALVMDRANLQAKFRQLLNPDPAQIAGLEWSAVFESQHRQPGTLEELFAVVEMLEQGDDPPQLTKKDLSIRVHSPGDTQFESLSINLVGMALNSAGDISKHISLLLGYPGDSVSSSPVRLEFRPHLFKILEILQPVYASSSGYDGLDSPIRTPQPWLGGRASTMLFGQELIEQYGRDYLLATPAFEVRDLGAAGIWISSFYGLGRERTNLTRQYHENIEYIDKVLEEHIYAWVDQEHKAVVDHLNYKLKWCDRE
jgi:hypothetical protein